jgi:protein phosphatase
LQQCDYQIIISFLSDRGCVRELNEDACLYIQPQDEATLKEKGALFVVADGMGGHLAGEVASQMAVKLISRYYYESPPGGSLALQAALEEANRALFSMSQGDARFNGMGTTCTALVILNGAAFCAHVGDSRIYLVRSGVPYVMTEDHSQVMEMVRRGVLSREQARHHPDKNVILRALGTQPEVAISSWNKPFPIQLGDRYVICSDGLYDHVTDAEINQAAMSDETHVACEQLLALAKDRGGLDNITVGIVRIESPSVRSRRRPRQTRESEVVV